MNESEGAYTMFRIKVSQLHVDTGNAVVQALSANPYPQGLAAAYSVLRMADVKYQRLKKKCEVYADHHNGG